MTEKQKNQIKKELQRLQDDLNLLHWSVMIAWESQDHPEGALAETRPNTPYNEVVIAIFPALEREFKKGWENVKQVLLHEMCHVVLAPFVRVANERFVAKETFMDMHEVVTSQLEKIITRLCDRRNKNKIRYQRISA